MGRGSCTNIPILNNGFPSVCTKKIGKSIYSHLQQMVEKMTNIPPFEVVTITKGTKAHWSYNILAYSRSPTPQN